VQSTPQSKDEHASGFSSVFDAIRWEKQLKGWSRAKKHALIRDDWQRIHDIVVRERRSRERLKRGSD